MESPLEMTIVKARRLALQHQGLWRHTYFGKGKAGVINAIKCLGYVQIDTISVVERAHQHVLWSRIPGYRKAFLEQLQDEREIFEYWSHAAAYLPIHDYRFCLPRMYRLRKAEKHWFPRNVEVARGVLDRITSEGPLMSRDFEGPKMSGEMWHLKPVKHAIHELVQMGKLMVSKRIGFQKVFDLPERVIPSHIDVTFPSENEYAEYLISGALKAHGFLDISGICYLRKGIKASIASHISNMLKDGKLKKVSVQGREYLALQELNIQLPRKPKEKRVHLISPFDNSIIQRRRLSQLFDFQYKTEIYLPESKRKYGYFSMPILFGDRFVGRFNPKADRKAKTLEVKGVYFEPDFLPDPDFWEHLKNAISRFCVFNKCQEIRCENYPVLNLQMDK